MYIYCTFAVSQNQLCKMKDEDTFLRHSDFRHKMQQECHCFRLACLNRCAKRWRLKCSPCFLTLVQAASFHQMHFQNVAWMSFAIERRCAVVQLFPDGVRWGKEMCPRLCSHCLWWRHHILPKKVQALSIKLASSGFVPSGWFRCFFTLETRRCSAHNFQWYF